MTRRRWIADQVSGDRAFLLGPNAEHLARVLRARVGQQFDIATPDGAHLGTIIEIEPERVTFSLTELPKSGATRPRVDIHLYLAIVKFERLEWAIEKCTELGASSIVPVIAQRTDTHLAGAAQKRVERWRRIAHEAAQQSRRESILQVRNPEKLEKAIREVQGTRVVLAETERNQGLQDLLEPDSAVSLAIGPEGGWTESELSLFDQEQWTRASLGPNILRAETAAIAALAITQACVSSQGTV